MLYKNLKQSDILKELKNKINDLDLNFRSVIYEIIISEVEKIKEEQIEKGNYKDLSNFENIQEDLFNFCVDLSDIIDNEILEL
tara:strand:+ start:48 stop:296 length:249 start_codon:yes stop_codon:yes gene_type:complete